MSFACGGFVKNEYAVDGGFEVFNYCTAENFYEAMLDEDFDMLDEASCDFIENIIFWLNYDGEIGKDNKEDIEKIRTGLFMTCKDRTFIDAIVENKNVSFAKTYIDFGSMDVRLFAICLLGVEINIINGHESYNGTILNMINNFCKDKNDYIEFLSKLFILLENEYNKLEDEDDKIQLLKIVRRNISKFKYRCSERIDLSEICDIGFSRKLVNK